MPAISDKLEMAARRVANVPVLRVSIRPGLSTDRHRACNIKNSIAFSNAIRYEHVLRECCRKLWTTFRDAHHHPATGRLESDLDGCNLVFRVGHIRSVKDESP